MGDLNVLYGNSGSAQMPAFDNGGTEMFDLGAYEQATGQAGGYIDAPAEGGYMDQPPAAAGSNGLQQ